MSGDLTFRLDFLKRLQAVSNKIHATGNLRSEERRVGKEC